MQIISVTFLMAVALLASCRTTSELASSPESQAVTVNVPTVDIYPALATPPGSGVPWQQVEPAVDAAEAPASGKALADLSMYLSPADPAWRERDPAGFALAAARALGRDAARRASADVRVLSGFYASGGRTVALPEPLVKKSRVAAYVPEVLRGPRFAILITGEGGFEGRPLRLLGEWAAHVIAAEVAVQTRAGGERAREAVFGTLELTVYGLALMMAVAADDPRYFAEETAFAASVAYLTEKSMSVLSGAARNPSLARTMLLDGHAALTTSDDAAGLREFASRVYGIEWAKRVLSTPLTWPGPNPALRDGPVAREPPSAVLN